jgi:hypothetical protein
MQQPFLLGRVLLHFDTDHAETTVADLSAVAVDPSGHLWVASDELAAGRVSISRLSAYDSLTFAHEARFALGGLVTLPGGETEADFEGLDIADGYLWFVGSHAQKRLKPKGKTVEADLKRLATLKFEPNRYLLGRIPLDSGEPVARAAEDEAGARTAALLETTKNGNVLIKALSKDPHLGPLVDAPLPAKENGFDIEGLAVRGDRVIVGLRGPVLRGWAILLDFHVADSGPDGLGLQPMGDGKTLYRKHFIDLDGLGVRDLCWWHDDLFILAGPTMTLDGAQRIYRLRGAATLDQDSIAAQAPGRLEALFELPRGQGGDNAEGLGVFRWLGEEALLIVYDSPLPVRIPAGGGVFADVFRIPA